MFASADSIIDALGGASAVAKVLRVSAQAVWNMKANGSIAAKYWQDLVAEAKARDIEGVTLEALAAIAASRRESAQGGNPRPGAAV